SKPFFAHTRDGSGVPGNGVVRQSANAQSLAPIDVMPVFTPEGVSDVADTSDAPFVSSDAGLRPAAPGMLSVVCRCVRFAIRTSTRLVPGDPWAFWAMGRSMPS